MQVIEFEQCVGNGGVDYVCYWNVDQEGSCYFGVLFVWKLMCEVQVDVWCEVCFGKIQQKVCCCKIFGLDYECCSY